MYKPNPLSYLNELFEAFEERMVSGCDQLVCLHIYNRFNKAHWADTIRMSDKELMSLCRLYDSTGKKISIDTIRKAKSRLKLKKLIDFKGGSGNKPTEYRLIPINPTDTPTDTPADTPASTPADLGLVSYTAHAKDVKDVKTESSIIVERARDTLEEDNILEYWETTLRGAKLTVEHLSELDVLMRRYGREWLKSVMKEASDANANPKGLSMKFLRSVIERKLKGGEKVERRDNTRKHDNTIQSTQREYDIPDTISCPWVD